MQRDLYMKFIGETKEVVIEDVRSVYNDLVEFVVITNEGKMRKYRNEVVEYMTIKEVR